MEKIYKVEGDDPEMLEASEMARTTFSYFWRELFWEYRRIVPGLNMAAVKAPFSDPGPKPTTHPAVEQMWIKEIQFDGRTVTGKLLNKPNWLKSVKAGAAVAIPLQQVMDWMYAISGEAYGAFTVNLMRSRMNPKELAGHDKAWGLKFGDPKVTRLTPADWNTPDGEHPMSNNMAKKMAETLRANPQMIARKDPQGWTLLHQLALAGSLANVKVLLQHKPDINAQTNDGRTALNLANQMGWEAVAAELLRHGAR